VFISYGFVHYLVCRKGPFDTLIIFTTTISVNSIYSTSRVVIIPIIWLYMTTVVVITSFSIIVSCIFIYFIVGYLLNSINKRYNRVCIFYSIHIILQ
jgi:hypothetical protein